MATNGTIVTLKKSTVSGNEPAAGDLYQAELAINTADADIFTKRDDGTVLRQSIGTVQNGHVTIATAGVGVVDAFDSGLYRSAKYVVQATCGSDFQTIEILVMHDGTDVYITRYGLMFSNAELATFDAGFNSTNIELRVTTVNNATTLKFTRTVVQA